MHPILHLIATQPRLLAEHADAYADLAAAELAQASTEWKRRALLQAGMAVGALVAVLLAGVAVMLWAVTPPAAVHAPWALWLAPGLPALAALACLLALRTSAVGNSFQALRQQVRDDLRMLRDVGSV